MVAFHFTEHGLLTAEAVTMAQKLVNREVTKTQLINDGFNRLSLNHKDGLPQWFLEEESNFYGVSLPVTKEAVRMLRDKQRALNARPMKKIAEARARKKLRAVKRLQKATKMAEGMMDNGDMSEKQKAEAMMKVMRRAGAKKTKNKGPIKTIVARGGYKGVKGDLKGVKGRYRIVDKRMKKDVSGISTGARSNSDLLLSFCPKAGRREKGGKKQEKAKTLSAENEVFRIGKISPVIPSSSPLLVHKGRSVWYELGLRSVERSGQSFVAFLHERRPPCVCIQTDTLHQLSALICL